MDFKKCLVVIYFIVITLLVLYLFFINTISGTKLSHSIYFRETFTNGNGNIFGNTRGTDTLAVNSGLTMKVRVQDTFGPKIDPKPNAHYSVSIDTFDTPAIISGSDLAVLPYYLSRKVIDSSNISLTVQPLTGRTSKNTSHYEDAFPRMFQLDVFTDFSSIPFRLDNRQKATTISVDKDGVLNASKVATVLDYSMNEIGYIKKDIYDPTHYFVTINEPTTSIKKVVFTWSLFDLCQNDLPNSFSGNCRIYGNCAPYSFTGFYNNFPGYSYLNGSPNKTITFGNCSPGSPSELCSGIYSVPTIK
jgi:hypothetical protein